MNNPITPFLYGETMIRTELRPEGPIFVIADVCAVLEISNPSDIPKRLHPDDLDTIEVIDSIGRVRKMNACNESGLYALIFQSRKAVAKAFTRWVTSEVLPTIRRTGSYGSGLNTYLMLVRDQIALGVSPDLAAQNAAYLCPPPPVPAPAPPRDTSLDDLVSRIEYGRAYCLPELMCMLPARHPTMTGQIRLAAFMRPAVADGRLISHQDSQRIVFYRLRPDGAGTN